MFFLFFIFFHLFFCLCLFRAETSAYGGSQAQCLIEAVAARATAMPDPSCVCDLHHSSRQQRWILNPLSKARVGTLNLMVPSWIHFHYAKTGTPMFFLDNALEP